ncbi:MAG: AmmeMemoRadiSam system protein B [Candidatus Hadarchaeales archaeon]
MRYPIVAGQFYSDRKSELIAQIENCYRHRLGPGSVPVLTPGGERKIVGAVVPHAGYDFSGPVAAHVYSALAKDGFPETFVIIGGHLPLGHASVSMETFLTPLGEVEVDVELAKKMHLPENPDVHSDEHAIEVQLPFLQHLNPEIKFVPVFVPAQDQDEAREAGRKIGKAIEGRDVTIIATTDLTHAGPNYGVLPPRGMKVHDFVKEKDSPAINAILARDPDMLFRVVDENEISVCGTGSVAAMLYALGKRAGYALLLKYATSYEIFPSSSAVGYCGIVIRKAEELV